MDLNVRRAATGDDEFCWTIYKPFLERHVFSSANIAMSSKRAWDERTERTKFSSDFTPDRFFLVEVDGKKIGWASISETADNITVENIFIADDWRDKGVATRIFERNDARVAQKRSHDHGARVSRGTTDSRHRSCPAIAWLRA